MSDKIDMIHESVVRIETKIDTHAERITRLEAGYFNGGYGTKAKAEKNEKEIAKLKNIHAGCFGSKGNFWKSAIGGLNQVSTVVILILVGGVYAAIQLFT